MLKYIILAITLMLHTHRVTAQDPIPLPLPSKEDKVQVSNSPNEASTKQIMKKIPIKIGFNRNEDDLYIPLAGAICIFINEETETSCRLNQYNDSISALNAMLSGDIDIIMTNSLLGKYAIDGNKPFGNDNMQLKKIRFIGSFFDAKLSILASRDANIKTLDDLKNTTINIGKQYTNQRLIFDEILKAKQWNIADFQGSAEIDNSEAVKAICDKTVDSIIIVGEDRNKYMKEATRLCEVVIVSLTSNDIDLFTNDSRFLKSTIPGGMYIGAPQNIDTITTKAVLLTTSDISSQQVELLMTTINKNLKKIKLLDESLTSLSIEKILSEGKIAQLHEGVVQFMNKNNLKEVN